MFTRLGKFVSRHWLLVIFFWITAVGLTQWLAPRWDDVIYDGDLAYMPEEMTSVQAERLLEQSFPVGRAKSEMVVVVSRPASPLTPEDLQVANRVAGRLFNLHGVAALHQANRLWQQAADARATGDDQQADLLAAQANEQQDKALAAWDEAIRLNPQLGPAYHNRALYYASLGKAELAQQDHRLASDFAPQLAGQDEMVPQNVGHLPIIDIWTYDTEIIGKQLRSRDRKAQLVVVRLSQEFMATDNIRVLSLVQDVLQQVRQQQPIPDGLSLGLTGSAAVGGDMLLSAAESIKNTELYTILLVVAILVIVYRSPVLVAVPLITIVVSLVVASGLVATLTQLHRIPGMDWWNFMIFTTTKIFVVVILFGAGTDYCLFLISRYREELDMGLSKSEAMVRALGGVGDALTASALTTILGLATMFFADFGKFRNSGPAIGLCLAVTLLACLTLAPALLRALGRAVYWPAGLRRPRRSASAQEAAGWRPVAGLWAGIARIIVAYPGRVLLICTGLLLPFAVRGTDVQVTYDFLSELEPTRPSRVGTQIMRNHFPIGETGPLIVLARTADGDLDSRAGKSALLELTKALYVEGVEAVRSISEPLGNPPRRTSLFSSKIGLQAHELTRSLYLSKAPGMQGDVARLEVVLAVDPFSIEAIEVLNRIDQQLQQASQSPTSYWHNTQFLFSGTTAAIRDLRLVTRADNLRIQILVVLAVLGILLLILRRPLICLYLIASVLFSYYVTIGATQLFFEQAYGATYQGLDWKVPLFLFVILVAVGQDYNIYLVTRVFEEQQRHGTFAGLREAIIKTGGIITSCGVIMAGTFVSMTMGSLRGIAELGFALSLGVLLDTFVVRPILVPAFLALLFRWQAAPRRWSTWKRPRPRSLETTSVS